jgi:hypothetical protein
MQHAVAENVFAGTAMARRAGYMYGAAVEKGPAGQIGAGLGQTTSTGETSLIAPTFDITHTGQELTVDGGAHCVPGDSRHGGTGGNELLLPRPPRPLYGREHHPHSA